MSRNKNLRADVLNQVFLNAWAEKTSNMFKNIWEMT